MLDLKSRPGPVQTRSGHGGSGRGPGIFISKKFRVARSPAPQTAAGAAALPAHVDEKGAKVLTIADFAPRLPESSAAAAAVAVVQLNAHNNFSSVLLNTGQRYGDVYNEKNLLESSLVR